MIKRTIDPKDFSKLDTNRQKLEFLISLANLSPSSHNMQPWFFKIEDNSIIILPNRKLHLLVADPDWREFYITFGTMIQGLKLIAGSYGLKYEYFPGDLKEEIGRFAFSDLSSNVYDSETLLALINRHNSRLPYLNDPIPEVFLEKMRGFVSQIGGLTIIQDPEKKFKTESTILKSIKEAFQDRKFTKELGPWLKASVGKHEDGLPGYNLGVPFTLSFVFSFLTSNFDISNLQVKIHKRMLDNASLYAIISTVEDKPESWLQVGMAFMNIAVEAQRQKISVGIMQASIENPIDRKTLQTQNGINLLPQLFFRVGYCDLPHNHSPRRPLNKVIIK